MIHKRIPAKIKLEDFTGGDVFRKLPESDSFALLDEDLEFANNAVGVVSKDSIVIGHNVKDGAPQKYWDMKIERQKAKIDRLLKRKQQTEVTFEKMIEKAENDEQEDFWMGLICILFDLKPQSDDGESANGDQSTIQPPSGDSSTIKAQVKSSGIRSVTAMNNAKDVKIKGGFVGDSQVKMSGNNLANIPKRTNQNLSAFNGAQNVQIEGSVTGGREIITGMTESMWLAEETQKKNEEDAKARTADRHTARLEKRILGAETFEAQTNHAEKLFEFYGIEFPKKASEPMNVN